MKKTALTLAIGIAATALVQDAVQALPQSPSSQLASNEAAAPSPQNTSNRVTGNVNSRIAALNVTGTGAGGSWGGGKAPLVEGSSVVRTPYIEYNYIDITDRQNGNDEEENVIAVGYDVTSANGTITGFTYEYGNRDGGAPGNPFEFQTHTLAGYVSTPIFDSAYISFVGGWSSGSLGAPLGGAFTGDTWFMNPGIGNSWVFGDLIVNAGISYLHSDSSVVTVGAPNASANWGQVTADVGARYNVTDALYVSSGIAFNSIVNDDFLNAVDSNWWRYNAQVGYACANGLDIYGGYALDFGHSFFENNTFIFGASFQY